VAAGVLMVASAIAGLGDRALLAQRGGRGGPTGVVVTVTRLTLFTSLLQLDDTQKKRVKQILDADYKAAAPIREQLASARIAIGQAIQAEAEAADVDRAVAAYSEPVAAMAVAEAKATARLLDVLTSEQREYNKRSIQTIVSMMRGAFVGKKWDMTPDLKFY
jgi:Spy/CpxP family protein refolding chaperone